MAERFKPRYYGHGHVSEEVARLAYEEYAAQGHGSQSFDRLHERGGFSMSELVMLLADALLRERATR